MADIVRPQEIPQFVQAAVAGAVDNMVAVVGVGEPGERISVFPGGPRGRRRDHRPL